MDMEKGLLLILHGCLLEFAMARLDLTLTRSYCRNYYDMEDIDEEAYVTYNGAFLGKDGCSVQFVNYKVHSKQICVKPVNFEIGCSTKVEYHRQFISEFFEPEKVLTCANTELNEWCGPLKTTRFYLLFRTSEGSSDDFVKIHVYLKYYPKEGVDDDDDSSDDDSSSASFGIVFPVVCVVVVVLIISVLFCVIGCRRLQRPRSLRTPQMYWPTGEQTNIQTGQGYATPAQPMLNYQPPPQPQFQPTIQGNYQLHHVQSNYPVPQQQGSSPAAGYQPVSHDQIGRHSPADFQGRFPSPSAPTFTDEDLPPSYESVVK